MYRLGRFLQVLFFVTLVLIETPLMAARAPDTRDASASEVFGLRTAPLSPQAQEDLNELEDALKDARKRGDAQGEAHAFRAIGLLNYSNERFEDALEAFSNSLALYRQLNAEVLTATELCEMASAYTALSMDQKALDAYKQALPMWHRLDRGREAATLGKIAEIFRRLRDGAEALRFDQAALEGYTLVSDRGGQATVLNNIGLAYFAAGNKRKAVDYFQKARSAYHDLSNLAGEATALNNIAVVYTASGDNIEALASFERELDLTRKSKDRTVEAMTLNSIAVTYSRMGESLAAHKFYGQAASIYHELGDRQAESRELTALSLAIADAKRRGHKNTNTDEVLNACPEALPIVH
ncbi:tetratricopeptide repeat protein [Telmatobacter sp. DSM 110680]|uniref:Tetratricopeptide repeat protein n=1 Tax=Telmatobacter sp. DSM 110680 TaxID=3036704 RepID=A0AAU7DGE2_9BACT